MKRIERNEGAKMKNEREIKKERNATWGLAIWQTVNDANSGRHGIWKTLLDIPHFTSKIEQFFPIRCKLQSHLLVSFQFSTRNRKKCRNVYFRAALKFADKKPRVSHNLSICSPQFPIFGFNQLKVAQRVALCKFTLHLACSARLID